MPEKKRKTKRVATRKRKARVKSIISGGSYPIGVGRSGGGGPYFITREPQVQLPPSLLDALQENLKVQKTLAETRYQEAKAAVTHREVQANARATELRTQQLETETVFHPPRVEAEVKIAQEKAKVAELKTQQLTTETIFYPPRVEAEVKTAQAKADMTEMKTQFYPAMAQAEIKVAEAKANQEASRSTAATLKNWQEGVKTVQQTGRVLGRAAPFVIGGTAAAVVYMAPEFAGKTAANAFTNTASKVAKGAAEVLPSAQTVGETVVTGGASVVSSLANGVATGVGKLVRRGVDHHVLQLPPDLHVNRTVDYHYTPPTAPPKGYTGSEQQWMDFKSSEMIKKRLKQKGRMSDAQFGTGLLTVGMSAFAASKMYNEPSDLPLFSFS